MPESQPLETQQHDTPDEFWHDLDSLSRYANLQHSLSDFANRHRRAIGAVLLATLITTVGYWARNEYQPRQKVEDSFIKAVCTPPPPLENTSPEALALLLLEYESCKQRSGEND